MAIAIDCHVHLYRSYDVEQALQFANDNLEQAAASKQATKILCLTERADCDVFSNLPRIFSGRTIPCEERESLGVRLLSEQTVYLVAGRQIATKERVELLALGTSQVFNDGLSFLDSYERVLESGALPVLNWAPGKWMFKRKALIRQLFSRFGASDLHMGDTSLRPRLWSMPRLMKQERANGRVLFAGSDPLPTPGEEALIGTYGLQVDAEFTSPLKVLQQVATGEVSAKLIGQRSSTSTFLSRMWKFYF